MDENIKSELINMFERDVRQGQEAIERFRESLLSYPEYALEWADSIFLMAPAMVFAQKALVYLKSDNANVETILGNVRQKVMDLSRDISNKSSGQCKNMLIEGTLQSYAANFEAIRRLVDRHAAFESRQERQVAPGEAVTETTPRETSRNLKP